MPRLIGALVVALLMLSGCAPDVAEVDSAPAAPPTGTGEFADLDFSGTTPSGEPFAGSSVRGKPVVLWFWAPWCPTCRAQIGNVTALAEEYAGRVSVVGVGGLDSDAAISEIAEQIPQVTHLVDPKGKVWRHFGVSAQSSYLVVSASGEIMSQGYLDDDQLNSLVARLVETG